MNDENINKIIFKPRILLSALDWGLGHATRCIPIINAITETSAELLIAAEGPVAKLLQQEFPTLVFLKLKGYRVRYNRISGFFSLKMLLSLPRILMCIYSENRWLRKAVSQYQIDAIISDNRFGFYHKKIPSVFITHQLTVLTRYSLLDKTVQRINYFFINKFSECWVPDQSGSPEFAGILSHPSSLPAIPVKYTGLLSRFSKTGTKVKYPLLILLSGPEPQRSIFEKLLLQQLKDYTEQVVFVRGLPGNENIPVTDNKQVMFYNHLPAMKLNELIEQCECIIARSGYSTIMDLLTLKKKAILVPTPGQTEQEYLAAHLMNKNIFYSSGQQGFSIKEALEKSYHFGNIEVSGISGFNKEVVTQWIASINKKTMLRQ